MSQIVWAAAEVWLLKFKTLFRAKFYTYKKTPYVSRTSTLWLMHTTHKRTDYRACIFFPLLLLTPCLTEGTRQRGRV